MKNEATHCLSCVHAIGKSRYYYYMPCIILKYMKDTHTNEYDGRVKIRVFGDRYWKRGQDKSRIRYVARSRLGVMDKI